jgi:putative N-acetylmannosamine-6-phosphate epimerase
MLVEPTRSQKITVTCRRSQQLMSALATASVMAGAAGVAADGCVALT